MNRKINLFLLTLLCFAAVYGIQQWSVPDRWTDLQTLGKNLSVVNTAFTCAPPSDLGVKNIKPDEATLYWDDPSGNTWEYYVVPAGDPTPSTFITTSGKEVTVTQDASSTNLQPDTQYEFYVRTDCGADGTSNWAGPFAFKTPCTVFTPPFWEGFNTDSPSFSCWTIVDNNNDSSITTANNQWMLSLSYFYEGTAAIRFLGSQFDPATLPHDDWLISPAITLDVAKIYELRYRYKTDSNVLGTTDFSVLLSKDGTALSNFATVLREKKDYENPLLWEEDAMLIGGISGEVHLAWQINSMKNQSTLCLDNVFLTEIDCAYPENLDVKDVEPNRVTLVWQDNFNSSWEYIVQNEGDGYPGGIGTSSTTKEVTVMQDKSGVSLKDNTDYEFYVRSKCSNGDFSDWMGPFVFKTPCVAFTPPFVEGFNTNSTTFDCWSILDSNEDAVMWIQYTNPMYGYLGQSYEGDQSMFFQGKSSNTTTHDDWLISPPIKMTGGTYAISYYYKTSMLPNHENEFEVLLSQNGIDTDQFTTVLVPKQIYKQGNYTKKIVYVQGITADVYVAWHVTSSKETDISLDLISIEEVGCIGLDIDDLVITDIKTEEATFAWTDNTNTQWEYYVQTASGTLPPSPPTGSGTIVNNKSVTVTRTNGTGGSNLQPNTEYEFWIRALCNTGANDNSGWVPIIFRTACEVQVLPFWEGFNTDSSTIDCWTVLDVNQDANSVAVAKEGGNFWRIYPENVFIKPYEGNQMMWFGGSATIHDDWLISPVFALDVTKTYRLRYHYHTGIIDSDFEVLLSDNGQDPTAFKKVLLSKTGYQDTGWQEEKIIIGGINGNINIGWHVVSSAEVFIDNVFFEEVDCAEPQHLGSKDEEENKATIYWEDDFGSDWEYIVQKSRSNIPSASATGTATKNKEVVVDKDKNGDTLEKSTEYEFYVRTNCGNGKNSEWFGPYKFRTACGIFTPPFWEGFNIISNTIDCWTIVDGNTDSLTWTTNNSTYYEGSQSMGFTGMQTDVSKLPYDDWLISPTLKFESGKWYRLKYHYTSQYLFFPIFYDYEFEVLLSDSGIDDLRKFTTTVVPPKKYDPSSTDWEEEYVFIPQVSGEVNLAWHMTFPSADYTILLIDNVFIEEVQGCPEPFLKTFGTKEEGADQVTLFWEDDMGATAWEYYIQEVGGKIPTGNGIATTTKESVATLDGQGNPLKSNTDYEFYVRTDCGNGEYSIWVGPYEFTTLCGVFTVPFWEGFNTNSPTTRCWEIINANDDDFMWKHIASMYEGDRSMRFSGSKTLYENNDWLVSPVIALDGGNYVLKYHYYTAPDNVFEVLVSTNGTDTGDFTTVLKPSQIYNNMWFVEEVIFFSGITGDANIAWRVTPSTARSTIILDNISIKKVRTCPEPYHVEVTAQTSTTADIEWKQEGGITEWEVLVVNYGEDETGTPVFTTTVTGVPKTTITGLEEGKAYTIYVRAKCTNGSSVSDWGTLVDIAIKVRTNDECTGAMNIPVNDGLECEQTISATVIGATESTLAKPSCNASYPKSDIWFEFTATSEDHLLKIQNWTALEGKYPTNLYGAFYDQPCNTMTNALKCFMFYSQSNSVLFSNLTIGQKYYIRLGTMFATDEATDIFNLCITSPRYLEVSPSGDKYTVEELVKDIWVKSDCDLVSNIKYQVGDGMNALNTLGYFNKNGSDFPFEEGIVLATHNSDAIAGPYRGFESPKSRVPWWKGDPDLNAIIDSLGGIGFDSWKAVSVLEFDFIPIKDSLQFEYLFVSDSFNSRCIVVCQPGGALFGAWLSDLTTGKGRNLALVPGTTEPISLSTIRDSEKSGAACESINPEYYWKNFDNDQDDPAEAPVNYTGMTVPMKSEKVKVIPGRKYHIKLAVADFCGIPSDASAVFFNARSFDLGNLDLGADLLIETNNALCGGECVTIHSGLGGEEIDVDLQIQWYKDGVAIPGATEPDYEACESGIYKVVGKYAEINCEVEGEKVIEIYPPISAVVHKPVALETCRYSLRERTVDLSSVEAAMFAAVDKKDYETSYYLTAEVAEAGGEDNIDISYVVEGTEDLNVYIRVVDTRTGCHEVFVLPIEVERGAIPNKPENVTVCAEYVFPGVSVNQYYYIEPGGAGKVCKTGDVLAEPGEHTIYLLQVNNDDGCYEETAYQVNITAPVTADIFEDQTLSCEYYELAPLSEYNRYYTEPGRQGIELYEGMQILHKQTVYVYASSENNLCTDESSFTIDYEDCPIPRGISPNNDGLNDVFDLTPHGVESIKIYNRWGTEVYSHGAGYTTQWHGQSKAGKQLPDGTYYYVIIAHGKTRTGWVQINK